MTQLFDLLPLGGLLSFLFGTANQDDIDSIKKDVRTLYANQVDQSEVLNELVTITNVSRGLINDNRNIIITLVGTILNLNDTIVSISDQLMPLFTARRFQLLHTEFLIHHNRIKDLIKQMKTDLDLIRSYLETHITGRLTSKIIDPVHLRQELVKIQKQLPPLIHLPEDPTENIWHYYRYLTVTTVSHDDNLILLLKIPLVDSDSLMTLYRVYNLPIFNHHIGKSLMYNLEAKNFAITKDNKYITTLTDSEFLKCTLTNGHFCNLPSALYHIDYSSSCLSALFLKNNDKIHQYCHLAMTNITGPQAIYLDKGIWAISVDTVTTMEIRCTQLTHIKTLHPPLTIIELQPACSAFSPKIKLPPYFEQYSKGFPAALKTANLAIPKFPPSSFRIWDAFNVSNITPVEIENLRKLSPAPSIPVAQLKAQITRVRQINPDKQTSWMYITGGGSGAGLLLLVVIGILIWRCKYPKAKKSSSLPHVTYSFTDPENSHMVYSKLGAIRAKKGLAFGQETVEIQDPVSNMRSGYENDLQLAYTSALLDQLEARGADVSKHHRRLRYCQAADQIEV